MTYATKEQWGEYATARGSASPESTNPLTKAVYTEKEADQALLRGNDHVRQYYIPKLAPEYQNDGLPLDVLQEVVSIAASLELTNPNIFANTTSRSQLTSPTKVGSIELESLNKKQEFADITLAQTTNGAIESLLRPYFTPSQRANQPNAFVGLIAGGC